MIGQTVSHYRVVEQVGSGGMGDVFKAEDTKLCRTVALKFLPPEFTRDASARKRFIHEAQAASALEHKNICAIHEIDETDDGRIFICMSYYEGESLKERLARSGPLPLAEALPIALQLAHGLARAHAAGVIHRDIKPGNIMLTSTGDVKIVDFGLAKLTGRSRITRSGTTVGTAAYMSPEQARGRAVDHRTDIWSFGVVLYEMLTGVHPFHSEYEQATIYSILNEDPTPVEVLNPAVSPAVARLVNRCLARSPDERWPDMDPAIRDISRELGPSSEANAGPVPSGPARRSAFRSLRWLGAAALLALALFITLREVDVNRLLWNPSPDKLSSQPPAPLPAQKHVLLLPLEAGGVLEETAAFGEGLRQFMYLLLTQLEGSTDDFWIHRADVATDKPLDLNAIQAQKGGTLALRSRIFRQNGQLAFCLSLWDMASARELRRQVLADRSSSLSTFRDGLLCAAADLLELSHPGKTNGRMIHGGTADPVAWEQYLKGSGFLDQARRISGETDAGRRRHVLGQARECLAMATEWDERFALAWADLGRACKEMYVADKDAATATQIRAQALAAGQQAVAAAGDYAPIWYCQAEIHAGLGDTDTAADDLRKAVSLHPYYVDAMNRMAHICLESGQVTEAEARWLQITELQPEYPWTYELLGCYIYMPKSRTTDGEKMFLEVAELTPGNAGNLANLLAARYYLGDDEGILDVARRAEGLKPYPVTLKNNLAVIFYGRGRFAAAANLFRELIDHGSSEVVPILYGNLGDALRQLPGRMEDARAAYAEAIRLTEGLGIAGPVDAVGHARLGTWYLLTGQPERGRREVEEGLKLGGQDSRVLYKSLLFYELGGERDRALRILERYLKSTDTIQEMENEPDLAGLRGDPRYGELMADYERWHQ
ncbi:MAG: protein kinase [Acidobacteria bacterium]|nr:protein kinase [Acidobacteriota bacterium]